MTTKPILVVMAAGMGSRYGGLKQVEPVDARGQTLVDYSLYDARRAGFERVLYVVSPAMEETFVPALRARFAKAMDVRFAVQRLEDVPEGYAVPKGRVKPWGTGHAIRACRDQIDAGFAVVNADDYYGPRAFETLYAFLRDLPGDSRGHYGLVGYELTKTLSKQGHVARGICKVDENRQLVEIRERTHVIHSSDGPLYSDDLQTYYRLPEDAVASMNLFGFSADFIQELDNRFAPFLAEAARKNPEKAEYFLPEVVGAMLREDSARVNVLPCAERWYGVTYRDDRPIVEAALQDMTDRGIYPQRLWS